MMLPPVARDERALRHGAVHANAQKSALAGDLGSGHVLDEMKIGAVIGVGHHRQSQFPPAAGRTRHSSEPPPAASKPGNVPSGFLFLAGAHVGLEHGIDPRLIALPVAPKPGEHVAIKANRDRLFLLRHDDARPSRTPRRWRAHPGLAQCRRESPPLSSCPTGSSWCPTYEWISRVYARFS